MTIEEKLALIDDFLLPGDPMTAKEKEQAKSLLDMPASQFSGSYSPSFIARRLQMLRGTQVVKPNGEDSNA